MSVLRRFGFWNNNAPSPLVRSSRGFSRDVSLIGVTLPSGETLQLAIDDAEALADAIQREIARVREG